MRFNAVLLALALLGIVAGAALIGRVAVGAAIIADSLLVACWALLAQEPEKPMRGDQLDMIRRRQAS